MITPLYAALLALLLIVLSARVIALRGNPLFNLLAFGPRDQVALERAIRGQANLTEYAPIFVLLLYFCEQLGGAAGFVHGTALIFLSGRLCHGVAFGFLRHSVPLRVGGIALTLAGLIMATFFIISHYIGG